MQSGRFDRHTALRERLADALAALATALDALGAAERAAHVREARESLCSEVFRLMVVGEFKRGKSTLINALLGQSILPAKIAPCTGVITEVAYGETPGATLYYDDPAHPPEPIALADLKRIVTIDTEALDDEERVLAALEKSPYSRIVVRHPLPLLAQQIEIVDSPGLNEHRTRTKLALDYLAKADALILVLSCQQALSLSELSFIDRELGGRNLRHVFFVWNHADAIAGDPAEQAALDARSRECLEPRIGTGERIFCVSAKQALNGRKTDDAALVAASGIQRFEAALERFLAKERGRVKLLTPLRLAESAAREALGELLPAREALLHVPLDELLARYEAERPRIDALERRREQVLRTVERRRDALITAVAAAYQTFVSEIEQGLREQVAAIPVGTWEAITGRRRAQETVAQTLQQWLEIRLREWQDTALEALFQAHVHLLTQDVEQEAQAFVEQLDAVRAALLPSLDVRAQARTSDVRAVDRVFSAVGGFFLGGIGAAIEGASFGFEGMSRSLVVHLGLWIALATFGLGAPVIFPVLAAVGVGRSLLGAGQVASELRTQVADEVIAQLRQHMPEVSQQAGFRITAAFDGVIQAIDGGMRTLIDEVRGQLRGILAARAEGEVRLKHELAVLAEQREALQAAGRQVDTIRFALESQPWE